MLLAALGQERHLHTAQRMAGGGVPAGIPAPLAAGGGHVLENIVFCCHRCNSAKRDLSVAEFAAEYGFVLDKWRL